MKIHKEIIQGTPEWHRIRWGRIGGTRAKGLSVDSDTLLIEMLSELTEDYQDDGSFQSDDMIRGQELEPVALARIESYAGVKLESVGWIDSEVPRLGISPDGITSDATIMCEIKCPARKRHVETVLADKIPKDNIFQCVHYFLVNPLLEKLYFCSFRPESNVRPVFIKELSRECEIDMGVTAKVKREEDRGKGVKMYTVTVPVIKTVQEWVDISIKNAIRLNEEIDKKLSELEF